MLSLAVAYFHIGLLDEAESALDATRHLNPEIRADLLEIAGAVQTVRRSISFESQSPLMSR